MHQHHQLAPGAIITKPELAALRQLDAVLSEIGERASKLNDTFFSREVVVARSKFRASDATIEESEILLTLHHRHRSAPFREALSDLQLDLTLAAVTKFNLLARPILALVLDRARNELGAQLRTEIENDKITTSDLASRRVAPLPSSKHEGYLREMLGTVRVLRAEFLATGKFDYCRPPMDIGLILQKLGIDETTEIDEFASLSDAPDLRELPDAQITAASLDPLDDIELRAILARRARQGETFSEMPRPEMVARILKERAPKTLTADASEEMQATRDDLASLDRETLNAAALQFGVFTDGISREDIIENLLNASPPAAAKPVLQGA